MDILRVSKDATHRPYVAEAAPDHTDLCYNDSCKSLHDCQRWVDNQRPDHDRIWLELDSPDRSKVLIHKLTDVCAHRQLMKMAMSNLGKRLTMERVEQERHRLAVSHRGLVVPQCRSDSAMVKQIQEDDWKTKETDKDYAAVSNDEAALNGAVVVEMLSGVAHKLAARMDHNHKDGVVKGMAGAFQRMVGRVVRHLPWAVVVGPS